METNRRFYEINVFCIDPFVPFPPDRYFCEMESRSQTDGVRTAL